MSSAPQDIPGASTSTTPTTRNRANTFSYPRWDANGNSHHPPPDVSSLTRTLSRSQAGAQASSSATSPPSNSGSTPSSILRLLGLSPSPKAGPSLPPLHGGAGGAAGGARGDESSSTSAGGARTHRGHNRGASLSSTSYYSSATSTSNNSPFYEDDEDGPPEAITPPQSHHLSMPSEAAASSATSAAGGGTLTNYGHELDAAHKLELDDVFDGDSSITLSNTIPGNHKAGGNGAIAASSQPLGRRSSWSPAVKNSKDNAYSSSPPAGVMSWLHGQSSTYPISAQAAQNGSQGAISSSSSNTTTSYQDYGASPVGLFRRLSLSVNRRPPPPAPASTISEVSDMNDRERIGRPLTKVTSAPPRRLSPMGERMLRAHYDSFS